MITGSFNPSSRWSAPWLQASVFLPGLSTGWQSVAVLLDTGAAITCLHPTDALRIPIPLPRLDSEAGWQRVEPMVGIGGSAQNFVQAAQYRFLHGDGAQFVTDGQIRIAQRSQVNQSLPSILGWDVLCHFRIVLDCSRGEVLLEPVP